MEIFFLAAFDEGHLREFCCKEPVGAERGLTIISETFDGDFEWRYFQGEVI
ncbi:hypothetical protein H4S14_004258 [Agrobacterium vitis]|nr:hypothetical protein [Agrobacterium vitis]MBE1440479.1 hypothetical protein [Agrobacterium vitis]